MHLFHTDIIYWDTKINHNNDVSVVKAMDSLNGTYKFRMGGDSFSGSSASGWVQKEFSYATPFPTATNMVLVQLSGTAVNNTYQALRVINTSKTGFKLGWQSSSAITTAIAFVYFAIGS